MRPEGGKRRGAERSREARREEEGVPQIPLRPKRRHPCGFHWKAWLRPRRAERGRTAGQDKQTPRYGRRGSNVAPGNLPVFVIAQKLWRQAADPPGNSGPTQVISCGRGEAADPAEASSGARFAEDLASAFPRAGALALRAGREADERRRWRRILPQEAPGTLGDPPLSPPAPFSDAGASGSSH